MLIRVIRDILIQSLTDDQAHECFRSIVADAVRGCMARKSDEVTLYGCLHVCKMILMSGMLRSGCCLISGL